jgi:glycosyltransferase involved in cell wall biosynthesis
MDRMDISIVIPLLNEEENVGLLYPRLKGVLARLGLTYEIIMVDDGSTDGTFEVLKALSKTDTHLKVIRFRRNFGQTAAFSAGFDHAKGEVIVTMDADLQNDPNDIPKLLEKMNEGYDVVSGWRVDRKDPFLTRRLPSMIFNWMISEATGVKLHDYGCSLKAYHREVIRNLRLYGEMHRFVPAIASWMGIEVAEVPVNHFPRRYGKPKYGLSRFFRVIPDLLTVRFLLSYSARPMQIFGLLGLVLFGTGTVLGLYLSILRMLLNQSVGDRPLLILAVLLVLVGVQLVMMGFLGELTIRAYYEGQNKPTYVVREILGEKEGEKNV